MRRSTSVVKVLVAWAILAGVVQAAAPAKVKLTVEEPSGVIRQGWPVTSGIPLAQGALTDPQCVALVADDGRQVPLQAEVLSRWLDGSVRWLLVDFQVDLQPRQRRVLTLEYGAGVRPAPVAGPIRAKAQAGGLEINTGPLRMLLTSAGFRLLDGVWLDMDGNGVVSDDERVTGPEGAGIVLTGPDGKQFRADLGPAKIELEQAGPLRACARIEGQHASDGGKMFRYVVRLHAFRGQPMVRALEKVPPRSGGSVLGIMTHFTPFALKAIDSR